MTTIKFLIEEGAQAPKYYSTLASGLDITAFKILKVYRGDREIDAENLVKVQTGFEERGYIKLRSLERILFGTGLTPVLPENMELQVRSRSGTALKTGLTVLNSPGTIDADYQGEIGIILYNSTPFLNKVDKGSRIAQLVPAEVARPAIHVVSKEDAFEEGEYIPGAEAFVEKTERSDKGFGSSGTSDII